MRLNQALEIVNAKAEGGEGANIHYLACGFEPLHLATFLHAHLIQRLPQRGGIEVQHGVYGDLRGSIETAAQSAAIASAVIVEWSDIDPRLGLRASAGWSRPTKQDIAATCVQRFAHLETAIAKLAARMPVAVAPPNLPLPPIGNTVRGQSSVLELELEQQLAAFLLRLSRIPSVHVLERPHFEGPRLDARMELLAGFPYSIAFSGALAQSLVRILWPEAPKKGLITDLDDTLWSGIIGEVGAEGVSWSQEHHTQAHGLYQQMLGHLAGCGVLLAACSKNELATAEAGLVRKDLFFDREALFPVHADWGAKSASIGRILRTWNIAADAVVFIDDNPMELDEAQQGHPGLTCLRFPKKDSAAVWDLLGQLRDLFGKPQITEEDGLRQASIRASAQLQETGSDAASPKFLRTLEGVVTLETGNDASDKRALELINKTNQFNLNGRRIGEGEWHRLLDSDDDSDAAILMVGSYQDKFGPLGKIAVLLGSHAGSQVNVSHWVMSCRAFSRRIEHHMLAGLFEHPEVDEIVFAFEATPKNQPLQGFFEALRISADAAGIYRLSRSEFLERCGALPHAVTSLTKVATKNV